MTGPSSASISIEREPDTFAALAALALILCFAGGLALLAIDIGTGGAAIRTPSVSVGLSTLLLVAGTGSFLVLAAARGHLSAMWPGLVFPAVFSAFHFGSFGYIERGWYAPELFPSAWNLSAVCLLGWMAGHALGRGRTPFVDRPRAVVLAEPLDRSELRLLVTLGSVAFAVGIALQLLLFTRVGFGALLSANYGDTKLLLATSGAYSYLSNLGYYLGLVGLSLHSLGSALESRRLFRGPGMIVGTALYLVLLTLLGDRSGMAAYLFPLFLFRHYLIRPIDPGRAAAVATLGFMLFSGVKVYRATKRTSDLVTAATDRERLQMTTDEMGFTLDTVIRSIEVVPGQQPHFLGRTYLDAFGRVVPNVAVERGEEAIVSSVWITELTAPRRSARKGGLGFSIVAEAYINFGFLGAPLLLLLIGLAHGAGERWLATTHIPVGRLCAFVLAETMLLQHVRNTVVVYVRGTIWMTIMLAALLAVLLAIRSSRKQKRDTP